MTTPAPVPPPPEPPAPLPAPTVEVHPIVEVHVPPPVGPTHSFDDWLYTNGATVLGAIVAMLAAFVAWRAVRRQICANAAQLATQIKADRDNVEVQLEAEKKHRRRAERLNTVGAAYVLVHEVNDWVLLAKNGVSQSPEMWRMQSKVLLMVAKLRVVDMMDEGQAMLGHWDKATATAKSEYKDEDFAESYGVILKALDRAVKG